MTQDDWQRRLIAIEDRQSITDLFNAYAWHFDRNEPDLVGQLFCEDATVDYGPEVPPLAGRDAIVRQVRTGLATIFAATSHHISNVQITLQSDHNASGEAYLYAWHRYRDGSPDGYLWGQYHNRFRRTADGWRIASLVLRAANSIDFHRDALHPVERRP